jgi:hypothetical protein
MTQKKRRGFLEAINRYAIEREKKNNNNNSIMGHGTSKKSKSFKKLNSDAYHAQVSEQNLCWLYFNIKIRPTQYSCWHDINPIRLRVDVSHRPNL